MRQRFLCVLNLQVGKSVEARERRLVGQGGGEALQEKKRTIEERTGVYLCNKVHQKQ